MIEPQRHKEESTLMAPLSPVDGKAYRAYVEAITLTPIGVLDVYEYRECITWPFTDKPSM